MVFILLAFIACWLSLDWLLRFRHILPVDRPNARSLHSVPTPRIGGVGIMTGILAASIWLDDVALQPILLGTLALATISLIDDLRGLPPGVRLFAHFVTTASCLFALGVSGWALLVGPFAVVWMANLFNFMDGADGLAGGMATFGFAALAITAWLGEAFGLAVFCGTIAAAALAFLRFNFPPARLFMGDSGSIPLGFAAAMLGYVGWERMLWPWWYPWAVFSPFVVDASLTLLKRTVRREKIWRAHKEHYYQRLIQMGWSHYKTALAEYALMLGVGAIAAGILYAPIAWQQIFMGALVVLYVALALYIDKKWSAFIVAGRFRDSLK